MAVKQLILAFSAPQGSKACFKCGESKPRSEFYRHPQMSDGLLGKCKECSKKDVSANYSARREQYSKYEQARNRDPERRSKKAYYQRRNRLNNPEKATARAVFHRALRSGKVVKPELCTGCNQKRTVEAHHTDYSKPLDVQWLCFECHRSIGHGQTVTQKSFTHRAATRSG